MSRADKYYLSIVIILIITVMAGAATLAIKSNEQHHLEIALLPIETPLLTGEIHINGAVSCPGIFPWNEEDTIKALLSDAGIKLDADLNNITIYIPYEGDKQMPQRIDINRAEPWLLQALPGIGEIRAQAIVNHREEKGLFKCTEDLLLVEGFGRGTFDKIDDLITVLD
jgi:competence protein ComEA